MEQKIDDDKKILIKINSCLVKDYVKIKKN